MRKMSFMFLAMLFSIALVGCRQETSTTNEATTGMAESDTHVKVDPEITAALAELSADDHVLAIAQKFCAVEPENLLGSMGAPVKVMIEGEPVFLCCAGCEESALADPQKTLASLHKLKAANGTGQ